MEKTKKQDIKTKFSKEDISLLKKELTPEILKQARNEAILNFATKLNSTISNNAIVKEKKNLFADKFDKQTVNRYLENPQQYEKQIRQLSTILTTISAQYARISDYLSSICIFRPIGTPKTNKYMNQKGKIDLEKLKKDYYNVTAQLENMNIQHEFQKITSIVLRDDIFYGYEYETNDSYYIQQLDSDYCKISTVEDGCYNFAFDFSYFDNIRKLKDMDENLIETYPQEFQVKYKLYKDKGSKYRWQELNSEKTICIKYLEELPFPFAPFSNLFDDIVDLSDYKELNKNKNELGNYKLIGLQMPLLGKSEKPDDFAVDPDTALTFYNMILNSLPSGVGAFLSATPFDSIDFNSSKSTETNEVNNAENNIMSASGISPINFGKGADTGSTVTYSNSVDQARMFKLYAQFERWLNRKFKRKYKNRFHIKLLRVGLWNLKEERDNALKQAQYGVPNKLILAALNGISQQEEMGLSYLENEVLKIHDNWKPLVSSHTQSGSENEVGNVTKDDDDISDQGTVTRDNDSNNNR